MTPKQIIERLRRLREERRAKRAAIRRRHDRRTDKP